ncbi:hypothetical protein PINS_up023083, partial [Pythium insidiosum]
TTQASSFVSRDTEALVFLHGYNCSLDYALNRFAQLLALGDFPSNFHPFIFSWPSGSTMAYFQARSLGCENKQTAQDFAAFLQSIVDAGYRKINIIAHSMGCRVYFRALELGLLDERLCDYGREDFVRRGGGYDLTRQFCKFVTIYANRLDNALIWSEILSRQGIFDPLVYSIGKRVQMLHRDPEGDTSERVNRASRWSLFRGARASVSAELDERGRRDEREVAVSRRRVPSCSTTFPSDSPCHPHDDPDQRYLPIATS